MKENTQISASSPTQWILARTSQKEAWVALPLPLALGADRNCDIIINAPAMRDVSRLVVSDGEELQVLDAMTGDSADLDFLKIARISLLGPFPENPRRMSWLKRTAAMLLAREKAIFAQLRLPALKKLLPRRQTPRLSFLLLFTVIFSTALVYDPTPAKINKDLSGQAIDIAYNTINQLNVSSDGSGAPYARGASFRLILPQHGADAQHTLSLTLQGLDVGHEFGIVLNQKFLGETQALMDCVDRSCTVDFAIPSEVLKAGANILALQHRDSSSSFRLSQVFVRAMEPAQPEDFERFERLYAAASRYYEERMLLPQNIRMAKDILLEASQLLDTKLGFTSENSRHKMLHNEIDQAFEETSRNLQFNVKKSLQIRDYQAALAAVRDLLKLYPLPSSEENQQLHEVRKQIESKLEKKP